MKIRSKFFIINGLIFLTVVFITFFSIWNINENRQLDQTIENGIKLIADVRKLHSLMKDLIFDMFTPQVYRLLKDLLYAPRFKTTLLDFQNAVLNFKMSYKDFIESPRVKKLLRDDELRDEYETAKKMSVKAFNKIDSFQKNLDTLLNLDIMGEEGIYKQLQSEDTIAVREFFDNLRATSYYLTNNFESFLSHFVRSLERESIKIRREILYLFVSLTLFIGLLTVMLTLEFARRISRRIQLVEAAFKKVARGDFSVRLDIDTTDEFGLLSQHLNIFIQELKARTDRILTLFKDVGDSKERNLTLSSVANIIVRSAVKNSAAGGAVIFLNPETVSKYSVSNNTISFFNDESRVVNINIGEIKSKIFGEGFVFDKAKQRIAFPLRVASKFFGFIIFLKTEKDTYFTDLDFIHFNSFARYASLILDNFTTYRELLKKGEAEYKALQSQINPHFIYNVLNGLIGLNRMQERKQLEDAILSLKDMLRYILEQNMWTTIEKEITFIEKYCSLQKLRFQDRLEVDIKCEERVKGERIPKLILQPIVENAVIHGIEPLDKPGRVEIRAVKIRNGKEDGVGIYVIDNGTGFKIQDESNGGIGLNNVRERLKLSFPHINFQVESKESEGTKISIEIFKNNREK